MNTVAKSAASNASINCLSKKVTDYFAQFY